MHVHVLCGILSLISPFNPTGTAIDICIVTYELTLVAIVSLVVLVHKINVELYFISKLDLRNHHISIPCSNVPATQQQL